MLSPLSVRSLSFALPFPAATVTVLSLSILLLGALWLPLTGVVLLIGFPMSGELGLCLALWRRLSQQATS